MIYWRCSSYFIKYCGIIVPRYLQWVKMSRQYCLVSWAPLWFPTLINTSVNLSIPRAPVCWSHPKKVSVNTWIPRSYGPCAAFSNPLGGWHHLITMLVLKWLRGTFKYSWNQCHDSSSCVSWRPTAKMTVIGSYSRQTETIYCRQTGFVQLCGNLPGKRKQDARFISLLWRYNNDMLTLAKPTECVGCKRSVCVLASTQISAQVINVSSQLSCLNRNI